MINLFDSNLRGCLNIQPEIFEDARGRFIKVFNEELFLANGLDYHYSEEYYSTSVRGVIRGLHFQAPPHDHSKLVYCVSGEVIDVVLDLRLESPTYGKIDSFELSEKKGNAIYIPRGFAHGFCVISDKATMVYKVTSSYSKNHDLGVLWSSVDFIWPVKNPILSDRDAAFPSLSVFRSPF